MRLQVRLPLIYGALLALVFVGFGVGAQVVMSGRLNDETRLLLTSTSQYIRLNYTLELPGHKRQVPQLPTKPQGPIAANPGLYLEIANTRGKSISRSPSLGTSALPISPADLRAVIEHRRSIFSTVRLGGNEVEVYYTPLVFRLSLGGRADAVIAVGKSQADVRRAFDIFNVGLFSGEALLWLLMVGVTWMVARSVLRPIEAVTARAGEIAASKDFSARVPLGKSPSELKRLTRTFNLMLDSLEEAYGNQQRFLADASHELRTPLTVIRGNLEYLEAAHDGPPEERQEALRAASVEAERLGMLVDDLLALSYADAGSPIQRDPLEVDRVVIDAYRKIQSRDRLSVQGRRVRLQLGRLDEFVVYGDYFRLLQMVLILLDNAVKYTGPNGDVKIELSAVGAASCMICVSDTGLGIPEEERERVFERFYRSPRARPMSEGSGLGLPIARWIAREHGGEIDLQETQGGGTTFIVTLPGTAPAGFAPLRQVAGSQLAGTATQNGTSDGSEPGGPIYPTSAKIDAEPGEWE